MSFPAIYGLAASAACAVFAYLHGMMGAYLAEANHPHFASWAGSVSMILTLLAGMLTCISGVALIAEKEGEGRAQHARELEAYARAKELELALEKAKALPNQATDTVRCEVVEPEEKA